MKRLKKKDCSRCTRTGGEAFYCMKNRYVFDVDLAREIVSEGHEIMELEPDDVKYSVGRCEINKGHLPHVDPTIPGIVAHLFFPDDNGKLVRGHRLIDGHHRAARCLQLGIPYKVRILSPEESITVLTKAPKGVRTQARAELAAEKLEAIAAQLEAATKSLAEVQELALAI